MNANGETQSRLIWWSPHWLGATDPILWRKPVVGAVVSARIRARVLRCGLRARTTSRYRAASYEAVRALVARGLGYGFLVSRVANSNSYEGLPLVTLPITPTVRPVAVDMIWASERPIPARTRVLMEFVRGVRWVQAGH